MSRYGWIRRSLMNCQMIRVISSPSSSTTGFFTLILAMAVRLPLIRFSLTSRYLVLPPPVISAAAGQHRPDAGGTRTAASRRSPSAPARSWSSASRRGPSLAWSRIRAVGEPLADDDLIADRDGSPGQHRRLHPEADPAAVVGLAPVRRE